MYVLRVLLSSREVSNIKEQLTAVMVASLRVTPEIETSTVVSPLTQLYRLAQCCCTIILVVHMYVYSILPMVCTRDPG